MIPLHDDVPTRHAPVVTIAIIVVCSIIFLWQVSLTPEREALTVFQLGLIPATLFGHAERAADLALIADEWTLLTSMFLHGGWLHLIGNMLYLWIFGNNVEDSMGKIRFIVFYLLSGVAAALVQGWADPTSEIPMIGASGAIGGVLGGYLMLHPHARVLVLIPLGIFTQVVRIKAIIVLGLWFVLQFVMGSIEQTEQGGVAYWAHIGGFAAGVILIIPFKRRDVPLFDRGRGGPWDGRR
jgi:membrane associated rhomboid family serine protease